MPCEGAQVMVSGEAALSASKSAYIQPLSMFRDAVKKFVVMNVHEPNCCILSKQR